MALSVFADEKPGNGTMRITNESRESIRVEVDGRVYLEYQNLVYVPDVSPGYHSVKVYRSSRYGKYTTLFSQKMYVKPRREVTLLVDRNGKVRVNDARVPDNNGRWNDRFIQPVNGRTFEFMKASLKRERFERNRMDQAGDFISRNFFTTQQVKELMQLFSSDSYKLTLAGQAYGKTIDREHYDQVKRTLRYRSSKRELERFLQQTSR